MKVLEWRQDGSSLFTPDDQWLWFRLQRRRWVQIQNAMYQITSRRQSGASLIHRLPLQHKFQLLTRLHCLYFEDVLNRLSLKPSPDLFAFGCGHDKIIWRTTSESQLDRLVGQIPPDQLQIYRLTCFDFIRRLQRKRAFRAAWFTSLMATSVRAKKRHGKQEYQADPVHCYNF